MAAVQVLPPPIRPTGSYTRKRRHSVSAPPPGFQLPFPHAPKPVSPLLTPSTATIASVTPRKRVSTAPLSPQMRPATLGQSSGSRANSQRRLATYGEQGVAAASLATLEASCAATTLASCENIVHQINLDEKSHLRKKQRPSNVPMNTSSDVESKPALWNVRTFPFHRTRPGAETASRKRLGIPTFNWPKPTSATVASPMSDTAMMVDSDDEPLSVAPLSAYESTLAVVTSMSDNERSSGGMLTSMPRRRRRVGTAVPGYDGDAANPREGSLRCRSPSPAPTLCSQDAGHTPKPIPKPIGKMTRRKSSSPPRDSPPPPPRYSSPLGPERHVLPPRPRFPRSMNARSVNELRFGKDGSRIQILGERGAAADMYRRVLLRSAHLSARKRELARLAKLAAQVDSSDEVYVLRLSDDVKGDGAVGLVDIKPQGQGQDQDQVQPQVQSTPEDVQDEKMDVDTPECGDIELLPDIPDMDFDEAC
ncbi:SubName: Full=Uncharacterized protein {ECO:0000313/EMBL:KIM31098.1} [Serendipita indica DSM 11827]|nr:SubName: Full=Uncharacterized protein {ECO:0000313/EMBL:KIM31098.1} [Serendipita indica DSM 11827]